MCQFIVLVNGFIDMEMTALILQLEAGKFQIRANQQTLEKSPGLSTLKALYYIIIPNGQGIIIFGYFFLFQASPIPRPNNPNPSP